MCNKWSFGSKLKPFVGRMISMVGGLTDVKIGGQGAVFCYCRRGSLIFFFQGSFSGPGRVKRGSERLRKPSSTGI